VKALFRSGTGRALELFRRRNRNDRAAHQREPRGPRRSSDDHDRIAS
jgi:hypothetical protein